MALTAALSHCSLTGKQLKLLDLTHRLDDALTKQHIELIVAPALSFTSGMTSNIEKRHHRVRRVHPMPIR